MCESCSFQGRRLGLFLVCVTYEGRLGDFALPAVQPCGSPSGQPPTLPGPFTGRISPGGSSTTTMSHHSPFVITPSEASALVKSYRNRQEDKRKCYLLQVSFQTVYGGGDIPQSCYKKLPRLINGIPLGAGVLTKSQAENIFWRYVEGSRSCGLLQFLSSPVSLDEAEETRRSLRDRLVKQAKAVFGDLTVKATILLSQCVHFDSDLFINDIAEVTDEGLHFCD